MSKPIMTPSIPAEIWAKMRAIARQHRTEPTLAEQLLWKAIRNRQIGDLKFRRQHVIERFIVDFCCTEYGLIIEVDGEYHQYTQTEDYIRQTYLESLGYQVLRFTNEMVFEKLSEVLAAIGKVASEK